MSVMVDNLADNIPSHSAGHAAPLVALDDVHTYYGKSHILHGVSLTVGAGEVVGLLGRNETAIPPERCH